MTKKNTPPVKSSHPAPPSEDSPNGAYIAFAGALLQELWGNMEEHGPSDIDATDAAVDAWFERYGSETLLTTFTALVEGIQPLIALCAVKTLKTAHAADLVAAALG